MLNQKNLKLIGIAFLLFYLLSQPTAAAGVVNSTFENIGKAGKQLATFVNHIDLLG